MNNIPEQLREFKKIEPDRVYRTRSREEILRASQNLPGSVWSTVMQVLEYGTAIALAGVLFAVLFGKSPLLHMLSPQVSSLNPGSLHAEAEAIDIQIQLADLNYNEPVAKATTDGRKKAAPSAISASSPSATASSSPSSTISAPEQNSGASSTSIDDALDIISQ